MSNDIGNLKEIMPDLSSEMEHSFKAFFEIVLLYNRKINLISKNSVARAGIKHFFDCYMGLKVIEAELLGTDSPIFDFGSGNGFPGLIAALAYPNQKVILVESDRRKSEFLKVAGDHLQLKNVEVHNGKVSDLQDSVCEKVISRAMAPVPKFLLESRKVVKPGGKCFLFKGDHWSTEVSAIPAPVFDYWEVDVIGSYELPSQEGDRFIVSCLRT